MLAEAPMVPNRRVVAVVYDGLCAFEFGVASELFGLARPEFDDWYEFKVVSVDPPPLHMLGGLTLAAETDLAQVSAAGTVVLAGWKGPNVAVPEALTQALVTAHGRGARVLTICSGVFPLAASGLLDGQAATTHWRYTHTLAERYPAIDVRPDVLFVDNGSLLTSAGSAAGIDLGLHLIRRDHGAAVANAVARRLVVAPARDGGQAQFIPEPAPERTATDPLDAATDWARANLANQLRVEDLAAQATMSPRTFARRFRDRMGTTPHRWLTRQRVLLAQRLLEQTEEPIEAIAAAAGFGSAASLRDHFRREVKTTPTAYRSRFAVVARG